MTDFVLVHGAWHGGWCWRRVVQQLTAAGHRAHAVTLTGLGDRAHLMSPAITLETHIADVVNAIESEELDQVVLAVHSYAGMIGTAIADRHPGRLRHLVYVDAVVPAPGESWSSAHPGATRAARLAAAETSPDFSFPVPDPAVWGLTGDDFEWAKRRLTPHPGHTYEAALAFDARRVAAVARTFVSCVEPAAANIDAIRPRLVDPGFWWSAAAPATGARVVELKTGHDPMITAPGDLVRILQACA